MFSMVSISKAPTAIFTVSFRVLMSAFNLDMVEVGGSNPPGPTKLIAAQTCLNFSVLTLKLAIKFCIFSLLIQ